MHMLGFDTCLILLFARTEPHFEQAAELIGAFGHIGAIVESVE